MLFHWTRECEQGIGEVRYDRKALQALLKKYTTNTGRLSSVLARGAWRTLDEPMLPFHKARLECMVTVCVRLLVLFRWKFVLGVFGEFLNFFRSCVLFISNLYV